MVGRVGRSRAAPGDGRATSRSTGRRRCTARKALSDRGRPVACADTVDRPTRPRGPSASQPPRWPRPELRVPPYTGRVARVTAPPTPRGAHVLPTPWWLGDIRHSRASTRRRRRGTTSAIAWGSTNLSVRLACPRCRRHVRPALPQVRTAASPANGKVRTLSGPVDPPPCLDCGRQFTGWLRCSGCRKRTAGCRHACGGWGYSGRSTSRRVPAGQRGAAPGAACGTSGHRWLCNCVGHGRVQPSRTSGWPGRARAGREPRVPGDASDESPSLAAPRRKSIATPSPSRRRERVFGLDRKADRQVDRDRVRHS